MKRYAAVCTLFLTGVVSCVSAPEERARPQAELPPALAYYLETQALLAQDDREGARRALEQLAETGDGELKERAAQAAESEDLEGMRAGFAAVSDAVIENYEVPEGYTVLHCPMAEAEGGAEWIQARGDVRNPYMGSAMLECGIPAEDP